MLRAILGVFVGYMLIVIFVTSVLLAAGSAVGNERLVDPQTNELSTWFIVVVEWPISLIAAIIGGFSAAVVAGSAARGSALRSLVFVILVIGFFSVAWQFFAKNDGSSVGQKEALIAGPDANAAELEAAAKQVEEKTGSDTVILEELPNKPLWDGIALPILGAVGILLGGGLVSPRRGGGTNGSEQS